MSLARRGRWVLTLAAACVAALAVAACGGSSSTSTGSGNTAQAKQILRQTFQSHGTIKSGTQTIQLSLSPTGSAQFKQPIVISISGPFQSNGAGKVPDSDFTISAEAEGRALRLQLISAGGHGYVTVDGNSYQLPEADYQRIESGFGTVSGSSATGSKSKPLSQLGIDPMDWLKNPEVAGTESIDGTPTTRVNADVNSTALLNSFSKILANASSLGLGSSSSVPTKISPGELAAVAQTIGTPKFSVWSANSDHSLRKLAINDQVSVSGAISSALNGLSGLGVDFSFSYGHVNQPQTITAPTQLKPYSQLQAKVREVEAALEYLVIQNEAGASSGGASTTPNSKYSQCIAKAGNDVSELQKCSSLL